MLYYLLVLICWKWKQLVGQYVQAADVPKRNSRLSGGGGRDAVNEGDTASMQPPGYKATQDIDFISERRGANASLNPRLVRNQQNNNNNTLSYVSSVTH